MIKQKTFDKWLNRILQDITDDKQRDFVTYVATELYDLLTSQKTMVVIKNSYIKEKKADVILKACELLLKNISPDANICLTVEK